MSRSLSAIGSKPPETAFRCASDVLLLQQGMKGEQQIQVDMP
jgi:hypothetical protein